MPQTTASTNWTYNNLLITATVSGYGHQESLKPPRITYGKQSTPFGLALIGLSCRGLCYLDFCDDDGGSALGRLRKKWPGANLCEDQEATEALVAKIFRAQKPVQQESPLQLHVHGTEFQLKVWRQLLSIPPGPLISYRRLAQLIDHPQAARAVGRAVGENPICYLIPCHRVIRSDGSLGGYRSGSQRKKLLLDSEALTTTINKAQRTDAD